MIKYHGTPLTPVDAMIRSFKGRHAMVSFEHPEQLAVACEVCQSIVLDNGAFSAWKKGEKHDFDGYVAWAEAWLKHPAVDWCVIPDVIDGTEENNDELLAAWPLRRELSVPVYHLHESLERLERLLQYPRIALGSSGEFKDPNTPRWWSRMSQVMDVCCDADGMPLAKLHGLRMLDTGVFSRVPLSSADSTNVARNVGFDSRWKQSMYTPSSKHQCAMVLMENIEAHTAAHRWNGNGAGFQQNMELLG